MSLIMLNKEIIIKGKRIYLRLLTEVDITEF